MSEWFVQQVNAGSLLLALPVAAVAGLVSFFSPCVVPLLPGYVSYATGLSGADLESARRGRMLAGTFLFVLGFSAVFVIFGTLSGALGDWLWSYQREISVVLGVVTIVVGLAFAGVLPLFRRDYRVHSVPAVGLAAAPMLGVLFAFGWTPCIGPTLTAVQGLALTEGTAGRGALLSLAYALGLGLPFILAGLAFRRMLGAVHWVRQHQLWVTRLGGLMLVVVGLLLVTGIWDQWVAELRGLGRGHRGGPVTTRLEADPPLEAPPAEPPPPPALRPVELARWAWRQLTSMRTALVLLFLLALASVPGSVVPQANIDAVGVAEWKASQPAWLVTLYERLQLFSVYDSVWFSAIYLLLVLSLVGCVVPRLRVYWRALRAALPRAPRNLSRLPAYRVVETDEPPAEVLARAEGALRERRYRVSTSPVPADGQATDEGGGAVSAERGRLREAGNLLFHASVLVVLAGFAVGQLFGYKGGVILPVGQGWTNALTQYDDFAPGSLFDPDDLAPLWFHVDDFQVDFVDEGDRLGQPLDFSADLTYAEEPGAAEESYRLRVNHPLRLDGVSVFLVGHGYAPIITVRDGTGEVVRSEAVPFLPQDASFLSYGVVKAPGADPEQLGLDGYFLPTYGFDPDRGVYSAFPDWLDPRVSLLVYRGDLGMDTGEPQSVYALDRDDLDVVQRPDAAADDPLGTDFRINLRPGQGVTLPDGLGSVELNGVQRWVKLQVSHTPGKGVALAGVVLALVGMMGSLFVRPRRAWVRVTRRGGRTVVEVAGLDRSTAGVGLDSEVASLSSRIVPGLPAERGARGEP